MKDQWNKMRVALGIIIAFGTIPLSPVTAGFLLPGYDLSVVQSGRAIPNAAVSLLTNPVWIDGTAEKPYNFTTDFTLPDANEVLFARLYLNIWGGTNEYTCRIDATVNGAALEVIEIGGADDANPTYDANQTCVYGSGYGTWQVAYSGVAELLNLDETANEVDVTISDPSGQFDGRTVDVTLVTVYRDPNVNHALDYYLAEADGYMRRSPGTPGSPSERILDINSVDVNDVIGAVYTAHYTHGTKDQFDHIYFNGMQLDGNDVAVGLLGKYGPDVLSFDVTDLLLTDSTVLYIVDETVVGTPSEFSLRAKIGLLEISRPYCREPIPGDVNGDCRVNLRDFEIMISHWLECNLEPPSACWEQTDE